MWPFTKKVESDNFPELKTCTKCGNKTLSYTLDVHYPGEVFCYACGKFSRLAWELAYSHSTTQSEEVFFVWGDSIKVNGVEWFKKARNVLLEEEKKRFIAQKSNELKKLSSFNTKMTKQISKRF